MSDQFPSLRDARAAAAKKLAYHHQCQVAGRGDFIGMCKLAAYWRNEMRDIDRQICALEKIFTYKDSEISGFLLRSGYSLKRIIRVAKELIQREKEECEGTDTPSEGED